MRLPLGSKLGVAIALLMVVGACSSVSAPADVESAQQPAAPTAAEATATAVPTAVPTTSISASVTVELPEPIPAQAPPGFELVWSDEFDGDEVDLANWTYDVRRLGMG